MTYYNVTLLASSMVADVSSYVPIIISAEGQEDGKYSGEIVVEANNIPVGMEIIQWLIKRAEDGYTLYEQTKEDETLLNQITYNIDCDVVVEVVYGQIIYIGNISVDINSRINGNELIIEYAKDAESDYVVYSPGIDYLVYGSKIRVSPSSNEDVFKYWKIDGIVSINEPYVHTVVSNFDIVGFFGTTIDITKHNPGGGIVLSEVIGQEEISSLDVEERDSIPFTYGDTIKLYVEETSPYFFAGWNLTPYDIENNNFIFNWGKNISYIPKDKKDLTCVFTTQDITKYIRICNFMGVLAGNPSVSGCEEITKEEYDINLSNRYSGITDYFNPTSLFYSLNSVSEITITASSNEQYPFIGWYARRILNTPNGYGLGEEIYLSNELVYSFTPTFDCVLFAKYQSNKPNKIIVGYCKGSNNSLGEFEIIPKGLNYYPGPPIQCEMPYGLEITLKAIPQNGYIFDGWYEDSLCNTLISKNIEYFFHALSGGGSLFFYANFFKDNNAIYEWEGSKENKTLTWRSRRMVSKTPFNPSCVKIYSNSYKENIIVKTEMASSPDKPSTSQQKSMIHISNQNARRLPILRPEKYMEVEVVSSSAINLISISTSMLGLVNGK